MVDTETMTSALLSPTLLVVCGVMAALAAFVYRVAALGSWWVVPAAAGRAAAQLAAIATVLAAAMTRLWTSLLVLVAMFVVATVTAARRSEARSGSLWLALPLAVGLASVLPALPGSLWVDIGVPNLSVGGLWTCMVCFVWAAALPRAGL